MDFQELETVSKTLQRCGYRTSLFTTSEEAKKYIVQVCAVTSIHRRKPNGIEISILLIDEELGV